MGGGGVSFMSIDHKDSLQHRTHVRYCIQGNETAKVHLEDNEKNIGSKYGFHYAIYWPRLARDMSTTQSAV